jgi:glutathione S-transferase
MKLYWSWFVNPQKIRLALNELGLEHQIVELRLLRAEQRAPSYLALNPNGKVPVLQHDDITLWESNAILSYLGEIVGILWPRRLAARGDALRWMFFESAHLQPAIGVFWFSDFVAGKADLPVEEKVAAQRIRAQAFGESRRLEAQANLQRFLPVVERHLTNRPWMLGESFSLVDCCYGPMLDALVLSGQPLDECPAVAAYVHRMRARPAWAACGFKTLA